MIAIKLYGQMDGFISLLAKIICLVVFNFYLKKKLEIDYRHYFTILESELLKTVFYLMTTQAKPKAQRPALIFDRRTIWKSSQSQNDRGSYLLQNFLFYFSNLLFLSN